MTMLEVITQFKETDENGREWTVSVLPGQAIVPDNGSKIGITTEVERAVTGILWGKTGDYS